MSLSNIDVGSRTQRRLLDAAVVLGISLRLFQYFSSVSVWLDEASLALDVRESSLTALVIHPLDRLQIAPKGFLLIQGIIFRLAGDGEYALRLLPLVGSILGVLLFRRLALRSLGPALAILAMLGFALSPPLIRYAAEGKPYGLDASAAIILTLIAIRIQDREWSPRFQLVMACVGALVVGFSLSSTFVLVGLGVTLVASALVQRDRRAVVQALMISTIWAVATIAVMFVSRRSLTPDMRTFMQDFWHENMLPPSSDLFSSVQWLGHSLEKFFAYSWRTDWPSTLVLMSGFGFIVLWRRKSNLAMMLAMPIVVALGATLIRQYPLFERLMLGIVPAICIFLAASAGWIADSLARLWVRSGFRSPDSVRAAALLVFAIPVLTAFSRSLPPYYMEEIKPVLNYINEHKRPDDEIVAHYAATAAVEYYKASFGLENVIFSSWPHGPDEIGAVPGLDSLGAKPRVWLIFTGNSAFLRHRAQIFAYLNARGVALDSILVRVPHKTEIDSEAFLYDFSNR